MLAAGGGAAEVKPLPSVAYVRPLHTASAAAAQAPSPLPLDAEVRQDEPPSIPVPDEAAIDGFTRAFLERKRDWLEAVHERTLLYRGVISSRIRGLGLPPELLYLPAIESGYQVRATSPAGASGLWQLMRNTASPLGLTMDPWLDERRDFWKATDASLRKLAADYRFFGDWHLALAAYNCGAARLSRIIRQAGTSDYWALRRSGRLPRETASFVPQFLAVSRILSTPVRYGLPAQWTPPVEWTRVPVPRCVDLALLSRAAGVPYRLLTAGNAELTMAITPPASYGYQLKVPTEFREEIQAALESAEIPLLDYRIYTVRAGDTLSGIARSFGVTVEMIAGANPAVKPTALPVGGRLLVPLRARAADALAPRGGGSG
jgi:membrane-bound lytic murein transglycosylase D